MPLALDHAFDQAEVFGNRKQDKPQPPKETPTQKEVSFRRSTLCVRVKRQKLKLPLTP